MELLIAAVILSTGFILASFLLYRKQTLVNESRTQGLEGVLTAQLREGFADSISTLSDVAGDKLSTTTEPLNHSLQKLEKAIVANERNAGEKIAALSVNIANVSQGQDRLSEATANLSNLLDNRQTRGVWGERMVEDFFRTAGLKPGVNYGKQLRQQNALGDGYIQPDYSIYLPQSKTLNLDVKFPFDNYRKMVESENDTEEDGFKKAFHRDVKKHISDIATKAYVDPGNGTLDIALMYLPTDAIYLYLEENARELLDFAITRKIIVVAPSTTYAVLAVIREATDNFNLSQNSKEILDLVAGFKKQWLAYESEFQGMLKKLDTFTKSVDKVAQTRSNALQKTVDRIDSLRSAEILPNRTNEGEDPELDIAS